ncbi:putative RNA polymerase II subunit B1 CTD phosphatase rpap2 [Aulostomus maculatus]
MDTKKRRNGGPSKSSKKGGKHHVKALSAEEEARRREVVREKLREKLELERRALQVVERLLEDRVAEDFLLDCARFITAANYRDAVEERSITKLCGYPVCSNKLGKIPTQQYKICTKTNKVYDITERKCFCSNFCYKASKEFELQISKTPLWLRSQENPTEIKLMKKGDGGSSGEEVWLSVRRLQEDDIEAALAAPPEDSSSQQRRAEALLGHSDSSDGEQEQDFVSSVVSQRQGPRVHWSDLSKSSNEGKKGTFLKTVGPEEQNRGEKEMESSKEEQERKMIDEDRKEDGTCAEKPQLPARNAIRPCNKDREFHEDPGVEEATSKLSLASLTSVVSSAPHTELRAPLTTETRSQADVPLSAQTSEGSQSGLDIIQVGMSKRGAAGLKDLLRNQTVEAKPASLRLTLLECLKRTMKEWATDETLQFLCAGDYSPGSLFTDEKEEEEELDEDDLDDEVLEGLKDTEVAQDPVMPLVDCHAQHLIQKRITVEKLTSCLRNILGPLGLTMSDVITDLNHLVRTFRFTNTNIIHKTPAWTLITVVLLHLLSGVSPVVREALETPASVEYLNTLMEELGLQEQDLLDLVQLFKSPVH